MQRISRLELQMGLAFLSAQRSICSRLKVGAVLVKNNRIIANSYNGLLPGRLDECNCDVDQKCDRTLHAEQNLIAFCAKEGISMQGCKVVLTHSPCSKCLDLLIQSGVSDIIYHNKYRLVGHLNTIKVKIKQYTLPYDTSGHPFYNKG